MSKFRAIELAIDLATRQRDALAQKLAQAQRNLDFAQGQMDQLTGYAGETDARWMATGAVSLAPETIRNHYQFMERLQQAVALQTTVIGTMQSQREKAHQALLQGEFRLAGLQQVLKARQLAQQVVAQRREQRATDEFAAIRHFQRSAERSNGDHHEH